MTSLAVLLNENNPRALIKTFHSFIIFRKKHCMAYDETLASRIDELLKNKKNFTKKNMFGGVGYMLNGNMCIGVHKNEMIVRCNPEETDQLLSQKNTRIFDISGKPMKGWLLIAPDGLKGNGLQNWFQRSVEYVQTLPKK